MANIWETAKSLPIRTGKDITGGFDIGFDAKISEEIKDALMHFVYWVEDRYSLPITLWVDFKYKHYLIVPDGKRVAYRFYWAEFATYPDFDNFDDIPVIELAVRTERRSMDEVLMSFAEAISHYFAWISRSDMDVFKPDRELVQEILQEYQNSMR